MFRSKKKQLPVNIGLDSLPSESCTKLFNSAKNHLKLSNAQFYNPYFDYLDSAELAKNPTTCLNNKYKILDIDYIIDSDEESQYSSSSEPEDSNAEEDETPDNIQHEELVNSQDNPENTTNPEQEQPDTLEEILPVEESVLNALPEEKKMLLEDMRYQDKLACKMRTCTDEDKLINCFPIMALIEKKDTKTGETKLYKQKLYCKRSPLLEPIKIIMSEQVNITGTTDMSSIPEAQLTTTQQKINSINNSSHVEALGMYCMSKLTESGACPAFPYYFGCVNGISDIYYHNITEEFPDIYMKKWFIDKTHAGEFEIVFIDMEDDEYTSSSQTSNTSGAENTVETGFLDYLKNGDEDIDAFSSPDEDEVAETAAIFTKRLAELDITDAEGEPLLEPKPTSPLLVEKDDTKSSSKEADPDYIMLDEEDEINPSSKEEKPEKVMLDLDSLPVPADADNFSLSSCSSDGVEIHHAGGGSLDLELEEELNLDNIINTRTMLDNRVFFVKMKEIPVNYCFMERMTQTLDSVLNETGMTDDEWLSVLFQVAFGLAVANKQYGFVHNDLHTENIMFQKTSNKYIYYSIAGNIYRVPTFGRVAKIIDFARATFKLGDRWIFSDVFRPDGEAAGQYKYPGLDDDAEYWNESFSGAELPNPSFDLVRLATTARAQVGENPDIEALFYKWSKSADGSNMMDKEDDFALYIDIAKNCHHAVPKKVLRDKIFNKFICKKGKVPAGSYIYQLG